MKQILKMYKKNGNLIQQQSNNNVEKQQNNNNTTNYINENNNNSNQSTKNRICRDFMRGFCRRKQCKYPHVLSSDMVIFCHDYQNTTCNRINCKFLHYTLEEEDYYKKFGEFPIKCDNQNDISIEGKCLRNNNNNIIIDKLIKDEQLIANLCKDYIKYGTCNHRDCCFISNIDIIPLRLRKNIKDLSSWSNNNIQYRRNEHLLNDCINDEYENMKRKSCIDSIELDSTLHFKRFRNNTNDTDNDQHREGDILTIIRRLDEEQTMLRRRVEVNEIKIAELRANNEYLMTQNAQLRINNQVVQAQQHHQQQQQQQHQQQQQQQQQIRCSVTQTVTQTTTPQVMTAVSIAPVQVQATPIVSIATPQTQIITNSGTPLAIAAANTSQGQQLAIAQQNLTSLSNANQSTILGTSQITLAPAIAQGPSMGLTINTSQALAMSNATQPIISYPVMTHSILPH